MNIFFKKNRNQYIESLEFFYFLQKLLFSLKSRYGKSINPLILDFLNVLEIFFGGYIMRVGSIDDGTSCK